VFCVLTLIEYRTRILRMRILLSNHSLGNLGGSETWTGTMHHALQELGHEVKVFAGDAPGKWHWLDMVPFEAGDKFDVGILNHMMHPRLVDACSSVIHTSHGVLPALEKPHPGADHYVSVSEEVQARSLLDGYESTVIRNPINTGLWSTDSSLNATVKRIAVVSNNTPTNIMAVVKAAVAESGVEVVGVGRAHGSPNVPADHIRKIYAETDLVVACGRCAYEASSMGRVVIPFDRSIGDPLLTPDNFYDVRTHNCSGRYGAVKHVAESLAAEIAKYSADLGPKMREIIVKENDHLVVAQQYLDLVGG
jgi:hypothetical protein